MPGKRTKIRIPDPAPTPAPVWRTEFFELDERRRELRVGGTLVELEAKPFDLLLMLLKHAGEVVGKEDLLQVLWHGRPVSDSVLAKCVSRLRSALGDDSQELVRTIHGIGYRLGVEPTRIEDPAAAAPASSPALQPVPFSAAALMSLALGPALGNSRYGDSAAARLQPADAIEVAAAIEEWLRTRSPVTSAGERDDLAPMLMHAAELVEERFQTRAEIHGPISLNIAAGLQSLGRRHEAHALLLRALRRTEMLGSPLTLDLRVQLAELSVEMDRHDEATALLEQVMVEADAWYGGRSTAMLDARQGLALLDLERGRHEAAASRLRGLIADTTSWYPQSSDRAQTLAWLLARALLPLGQLQEAEALLTQVQCSGVARFEAQTPGYHELRLSLASLRRLQGRLSEARPLLDQLLLRSASRALEWHRLRLLALQERAQLLRLLDETELARADLLVAQADAQRYFGDSHSLARRLAQQLAELA
ncbi:MAG TPA: winged helix-turn-helix domain-containing protein [Solimonas sp.]|nr:winged helix-turn-helix domain-containing protein [Solimonas sp.]